MIDDDFTGPNLAAWSSNCWTPVDAKGLAIGKQNKFAMADAAMQAAFRKRLAGVSEAYVSGWKRRTCRRGKSWRQSGGSEKEIGGAGPEAPLGPARPALAVIRID